VLGCVVGSSFGGMCRLGSALGCGGITGVGRRSDGGSLVEVFADLGFGRRRRQFFRRED